MERDEALRLLKGGEAGIAEWNERRNAGEPIPNLKGADLGAAKLLGANLWRADLGNADLGRANLQGAYLAHSNFTDTDLSSADVSDADFGDAFLVGARFHNTTLRSTNFTNALFGFGLFARVDLSSTPSISEANFSGPSEVSTSTLALSKGSVPAKFLRGCGMADWEIEAARLYDRNLSTGERTDIVYRIVQLQGARAFQYYSVFLSHSHMDKAFARALHSGLQERGIRCWLDEHQLLPGDRMLDRIDHGIKHWDKVILCCSKAALENSWWVADEINRALNKERAIQKDEGRKVDALIPLDLDGHVFEWKDALSAVVKERQIADFREWKNGEPLPSGMLDKLIRALSLNDVGREPPPPSLL